MSKPQIKGCSLIIFICLWIPIHVNASVENNRDFGYSYTIKYPQNQVGDGGALNIRMRPNQTQRIEIEIKNYDTKELTLAITLSSARTNVNGVIDYGNTQLKKDPSMKMEVTDLVQVPDKVSVAATSIAHFFLEIKAPNKAYNGIITGGVQLQKVEDSLAKGETTDGVSIVNKIVYLFGITISMSDKRVTPQLKLRKVYPMLNNSMNAIAIEIANVKALKMKNLTIDAVIKKKNQKEVLYEKKQTKIELAPQSIMPYSVSLDGQKMQAGNYTVYVHATDGEKEWQWTKNFNVTIEKAKEQNQQDVNFAREASKETRWPMAAFLVGISGLGCFLYCYYQKRKKRYSKRKKKKQKK